MTEKEIVFNQIRHLVEQAGNILSIPVYVDIKFYKPEPEQEVTTIFSLIIGGDNKMLADCFTFTDYDSLAMYLVKRVGEKLNGIELRGNEAMETYKMKIKCNDCFHEFVADTKEGLPFNYLDIKCPNCGIDDRIISINTYNPKFKIGIK